MASRGRQIQCNTSRSGTGDQTPDHRGDHLIDIRGLGSGCLDKLETVLFREAATIVSPNDSLILAVDLIPDEEAGDAERSDLLHCVEPFGNIFKGKLVGDIVNNEDPIRAVEVRRHQ
jgi:hypothetical protein